MLAVADLLALAGLDRALADRLVVDGPDHVLPTTYPVTSAAVASVGAALLAGAQVMGDGAEDAEVSVDTRHLAAAFRSERLLRVDDGPPVDPWDPIAGHYPVADGGWVQLHTNFAHHRAAALAALGLPADATRDEVSAELEGWRPQEVEDAVAAAGGCASAMRSASQWAAHPQAVALDGLEVLSVERVADAPAVDPPASGLRVLDLSRVIAGPVAGRVLGALGADVIEVSSPDLPQIDSLLADTSVGKRSVHLDLAEPDGYEALGRLVEGADVVIDGYRPGALARLGAGASDLWARRPGLVVVELSAYDEVGPWAGRRGYDSLVQTATGICDEGRRAVGGERPVPLPCQALDHATGYLAAFGALAAAARRRHEGGSWRVRVALARTARWLGRLGRLADGTHVADPGDALAQWTSTLDSPLGRVRLVDPPGAVGGVPLRWRGPPPARGGDAPEW